MFVPVEHCFPVLCFDMSRTLIQENPSNYQKCSESTPSSHFIVEDNYRKPYKTSSFDSIGHTERKDGRLVHYVKTISSLHNKNKYLYSIILSAEFAKTESLQKISVTADKSLQSFRFENFADQKTLENRCIYCRTIGISPNSLCGLVSWRIASLNWLN